MRLLSTLHLRGTIVSRRATNEGLRNTIKRELTTVAPVFGAVALSSVLAVALRNGQAVSPANPGSPRIPVATAESVCSTDQTRGLVVGIAEPQLNQLAGLDGKRAETSAWRAVNRTVYSTLEECRIPTGTGFREGFSVAASGLHGAAAAARLAGKLTTMAGGVLNMPVGYEGFVAPDAYYGEAGVATLLVQADPVPVNFKEESKPVHAVIDPHFVQSEKAGF